MRQTTFSLSLAVLLASGLFSSTTFAAPYSKATRRTPQDTPIDAIRESEFTVNPAPVKRNPQDDRAKAIYDASVVINTGDVLARRGSESTVHVSVRQEDTKDLDVPEDTDDNTDPITDDTPSDDNTDPNTDDTTSDNNTDPITDDTPSDNNTDPITDDNTSTDETETETEQTEGPTQVNLRRTIRRGVPEDKVILRQFTNDAVVPFLAVNQNQKRQFDNDTVSVQKEKRSVTVIPTRRQFVNGTASIVQKRRPRGPKGQARFGL